MRLRTEGVMNMRAKIFQILIKVAEWVGTVNRANMHSDDFMLVEGTTADGRYFHVSLNIQDKKEEKENA
jgi:hypothetical protein